MSLILGVVYLCSSFIVAAVAIDGKDSLSPLTIGLLQLSALFAIAAAICFK